MKATGTHRQEIETPDAYTFFSVLNKRGKSVANFHVAEVFKDGRRFIEVYFVEGELTQPRRDTIICRLKS